MLSKINGVMFFVGLLVLAGGAARGAAILFNNASSHTWEHAQVTLVNAYIPNYITDPDEDDITYLVDLRRSGMPESHIFTYCAEPHVFDQLKITKYYKILVRRPGESQGSGRQRPIIIKAEPVEERPAFLKNTTNSDYDDIIRIKMQDYEAELRAKFQESDK
jgi:hypothetical protein